MPLLQNSQLISECPLFKDIGAKSSFLGAYTGIFDYFYMPRLLLTNYGSSFSLVYTQPIFFDFFNLNL